MWVYLCTLHQLLLYQRVLLCDTRLVFFFSKFCGLSADADANADVRAHAHAHTKKVADVDADGFHVSCLVSSYLVSVPLLRFVLPLHVWMMCYDNPA